MNSKQLFVIFSTVIVCLLTSVTHAQNRATVSDDQKYYVSEKEMFRFIYTAPDRNLLSLFDKMSLEIRKTYDSEFHKGLDEKPTIILASSQNQIANGFATVIPRLHSVFYDGGADLVDEFSANSWLYTLLSHEMVHLYQLSAKEEYGQFLKRVFGASLPSPMTPFTYMMYPTIFLPTILLEGNAVFNEGRFGNGGRLYNGAIRSLFLQLAKNGLITTERFMNDHLYFPYGSEKYWLGGYLQLDLAERHGANSVNNYFAVHSYHMINPFLVNQSFLETYGEGYEQALKSLVTKWKPLTDQPLKSNEHPILTSTSHAGINKNFQKNGDEILFLTTDGKSLPVVNIYNTSTKRWSHKSTNIPFGRLLRDTDDKIYSVASTSINNHQISYGLYLTPNTWKPESINKIFYDIQGKNKIWADANSSFLAPDVYASLTTSPTTGDTLQSTAPGAAAHDKTANHVHIGLTASSAIISRDHHVYYFKQKGKEHTLYKDQAPIFSYKGYYGYPVEVADEEKIYFIGPSEKGSTLYSWQKNQFFREHTSDAIVDAKLVNSTEALISEITTDGYNYSISNLKQSIAAPFEYQYFFESDPKFQLLSDVTESAKTTDATTSSSTATTAASATTSSAGKTTATSSVLNETEYSSASNFQFDGIDPILIFGSTPSVIGQFAVRFSDPLQNNSLKILLGNGEYGENEFGLVYNNTKHVVNWDAQAIYRRQAVVDTSVTNKTVVLDRYDSWLAATGFDYTFYKRSQWASSFSSHLVYENDTPKISVSDAYQRFSLLSQILLDKIISPRLAYKPYQEINFEIANLNSRDINHWRDLKNKFGTQLNVEQDIYHETNLTAGYSLVTTDSKTANLQLDSSLNNFPLPSAVNLSSYTTYIVQNYYELRRLHLDISQTINWSYYFTKFPFSIRRFSVFTLFNEYYGALARREDPETLFHEYGYGLDFELLLLHKFPIHMIMRNVKSNYKDDSSSIIVLGANANF
jgi:hypothetical protein